MSDLDALLIEAQDASSSARATDGAGHYADVIDKLRLRLTDTVAALRSVQVPVTEEWLEEHVIGVLDDESHEDVCSCGEWPESCVTYGVRRPWSHDASRAIEYIARNFTVLPSPGTTTEEE